MTKYRAAAFDMDGLMFKTEDVYKKAADELLGRRGYPYTQELYRAVMGRPPRFCFEQFIKAYNLPETWEELAAESEEIFLELLKDGFEAQPGLFELLDFLEKKRIDKCVATSSGRRITTAILERNGVGNRFRFILTSNDITRGKPNPQVYLLAAERFGVAPGEMAVFEDSEAGIASAKGAGADCFALRADHNRSLDLSAANVVAETLVATEILSAFE